MFLGSGLWVNGGSGLRVNDAPELGSKMCVHYRSFTGVRDY